EAGLEDRAEEHTTLHRGLFRPQVPVQQVGEDEEVLRREAVLPHHLRERTTEAIRAEIASEPGNLAPRLRAQPRTLLATELRVAHARRDALQVVAQIQQVLNARCARRPFHKSLRIRN